MDVFKTNYGTERAERYKRELDAGYIMIECNCIGGIVPGGGYSFYESGIPEECTQCWNGIYWMTPNDRIVGWYGGWFLGATLKGEYEKTLERKINELG